uniref:DUF5679 domain-containing protein n=1 Tax=viral metagenome TaxID=1070528 RepID=A0A6C0LW99_9ZZZZ
MPPKMKENEFYCVTCKSRVFPTGYDKVVLSNPKRPNGVPAMKSICPHCSQKLFKFTSSKA